MKKIETRMNGANRWEISLAALLLICGCQVTPPDPTSPGGQGTSPGGPGGQSNPGGQGTSQGDPDGAADPNCRSQTCPQLGMECGAWGDGCGGTLSCGSCPGGKVCDVGHCAAAGAVSHPRAKNPFEGASFYLNPEYARSVEASRKRAPTQLAAAIDKVKANPTAIWLDRIAAIEEGADRLGMEGHLNEALKQQSGAADKPLVIEFVVYDLPNRDCAAFSSNGELKVEQDGLRRYQTEYIDAIAKKLGANPLYQKLRVVAIVEPDSLPNLVTNLGVYEKCRQSETAYRQGITYAVTKLAEIPNVYLYLDIAHSGWLGWEHTDKAAQLYKEVLGTNLTKVSGFAVNVANYSAVSENFNPYDDVNKYMDLIKSYYEWNRVIDEQTFVAKLQVSFPGKGFLIDTSRNGWKSQPIGTPIETRTHRGNWCNIQKAGIGERPRANPLPGVDAYVWIKPPGESDGTSDAAATTANDEGKSYDKMCGQSAVERPYAPGKSIPTDALPSAPHAGKWFHEQFLMLVQNATPAP